MLNEHKLQTEIERTNHARRLGGFDKTCIVCGEPDPRCLEMHHLAGKDYGNDLVPVCRNCHRKLTDKKANKPAPIYPSRLDQIGHWLLGIASFLFELAKRAFEFGTILIEAAKVCPKPYGYMAEVSQ